MKRPIYSIRDKVAGIFNKPFVEVNDASAIRAFTNAVASHPDKDDYELYSLGILDDNSGVIEDTDAKRLFTGLEVIAVDALHTEEGE